MSSAIDVEKVRMQTKGCDNVIHLNAAGASLMPGPVYKTMIEHLTLENEIGGYEAAAAAKEESEMVYDEVAKMLSCDREEVALSDNATRSWSMIFYSLKFSAEDVILTSVSEYGSNYIPFLQLSKRTGCTVVPVPNDEHGQLDVQALESLVSDTYKGRVKLIGVTHVPTNGGLVNPAKEIGEVAKKHDIYYLLDACQSVGQMPLDVTQLGCSFLSGTSRKYLRGPRGVGFLYVNKAVLEDIEPVFLDIHSATWGGTAKYAPKDTQGATGAVEVKPQASSMDSDDYYIRKDARRFETWEASIASQLAFGAAVKYANNLGLDNIYSEIQSLASWLRGELGKIDGLVVADLGKEKCGIITWYFDLQKMTDSATAGGKQDPDAFSAILSAGAVKEAMMANKPKRINVTVTGATSTLLDAQQRELPDLVRSSVSYYNTREEAEAMLSVIRGLVSQYREAL